MKRNTNAGIFHGRLTRDPEWNQQGTVVKFGIAVEASPTKEKNDKGYTICNTAFIDCKSFFQAVLDAINNELAVTGAEIMVMGYFETEKWVDKETNEPRSRLYLYATGVTLYPPMEPAAPPPPPAKPAARPAARPAAATRPVPARPAPRPPIRGSAPQAQAVESDEY